MSQFVPSPQQSAVFEFILHGRGSAIVEAVAGAGKTTTLIEACKLIAQMPRTSAIFTAFNKKIADEIGERLQAAGIDWKQVRSATFHSLGYSAWRKVAPGCKVNSNKISDILEAGEVPFEFRSFVTALVSIAKQNAVGVLRSEGDMSMWFGIVDHHDLAERLENVNERDAVERGIAYARTALSASVELDHEQVDFDDMIYAPLIHDVRFWQNDFVLVDEAQDTNPARRALARKMLKPSGRLIAVGDPHQAIYGFTGADNDSLDIIEDEFGAARLPLTVTYRCPKTVVAHARQWVGHITAHDTAPAGSVIAMTQDEFMKMEASAFDKGSAILCRNTKPLVETAFALIRRRIPCHIEGRDIGEGLIKLANKWKTVHTVADLRERLQLHLEAETERLSAKKQEAKLAVLVDKIDTLFVFMEALHDDSTIGELAGEIYKVFADSPAPGITLSTIHKAKGREWNRVYWLGRNRYQPSRFARQAWQQEQELNLMYVACTRAKQTLVEIEVPFNRREG